MNIRGTPYLLAQQDLERGVFEQPGPEAHPRIIQAFELVGMDVDDDVFNHCAVMMCLWHHESGSEHPGTAVARDWLRVGRSVPRHKSRPSDVFVFWREHPTQSWMGHVAMSAAWSEHNISHLCIGANQRQAGRDRVCQKDLLLDKLLDIRRITP